VRANAPHNANIVVRCGKSKNFRLCVHEYVYRGFPRGLEAVTHKAAELRLRLLISLIEKELFLVPLGAPPPGLSAFSPVHSGISL
jgi:hypothetical protein